MKTKPNKDPVKVLHFTKDEMLKIMKRAKKDVKTLPPWNDSKLNYKHGDKNG